MCIYIYVLQSTTTLRKYMTWFSFESTIFMGVGVEIPAVAPIPNLKSTILDMYTIEKSLMLFFNSYI